MCSWAVGMVGEVLGGGKGELLVPSGFYRREQYGKMDSQSFIGTDPLCRCGFECLNLKTMFKAVYFIDSQVQLIKGFLV